MKKRFVVTLLLISIALIFSASMRAPSQNLSKRYLVRLYAGDKVVGTWSALNIGKIEGQTLTFATGDEVTSYQVRIQGTYSVEEQP